MRKFIIQGMVQFDSESKKPTICGDLVRWLDVFKCKVWFEKQAEKKAWKYFNEKYPQWKGYIQLI